MNVPVCPNCGQYTTFTECEAEWTERHDLDCGPYEHIHQRWLTCDRCGAETDRQELARNPASGIDKPAKHV